MDRVGLGLESGLVLGFYLKVKGKGHQLDIVPLSDETSLQRRSGITCIVEGFHTCTTTRLSTNGINHIFPAKAGPHLPIPEG